MLCLPSSWWHCSFPFSLCPWPLTHVNNCGLSGSCDFRGPGVWIFIAVAQVWHVHNRMLSSGYCSQWVSQVCNSLQSCVQIIDCCPLDSLEVDRWNMGTSLLNSVLCTVYFPFLPFSEIITNVSLRAISRYFSFHKHSQKWEFTQDDCDSWGLSWETYIWRIDGWDWLALVTLSSLNVHCTSHGMRSQWDYGSLPWSIT